MQNVSTTTNYRSKFISLIVLTGMTVCFFMGGITLIVHAEFFTSRRLIDRLLFALPTQFFLSLLGVTKQRKKHMGYFFMCVTTTLLAILSIAGYFSFWTGVLCVLRGATGRYMYRRQRQRLLNRRRRSARGYIASQVALRGSCISFLTTTSIISTIGRTGINCEQLETSLRLSGIQQQIDISSLGGFLGVNDTISTQTLQLSGSNPESHEGVLGLLTSVKSEIYDLIIEQKDMLNHSLCGLINTQLITIQQRPGRQIAGILLLYILIRPLVSLLARLCMPLWILIRNILIRSKVIKKENKRVRVTGLAFK